MLTFSSFVYFFNVTECRRRLRRIRGYALRDELSHAYKKLRGCQPWQPRRFRVATSRLQRDRAAILRLGKVGRQRDDLVALLGRLQLGLFRCHFRESPRFGFALVGDAYLYCTSRAKLAVEPIRRNILNLHSLAAALVLVRTQPIRQMRWNFQLAFAFSTIHPEIQTRVAPGRGTTPYTRSMRLPAFQPGEIHRTHAVGPSFRTWRSTDIGGITDAQELKPGALEVSNNPSLRPANFFDAFPAALPQAAGPANENGYFRPAFAVLSVISAVLSREEFLPLFGGHSIANYCLGPTLFV